MKRYQVRSGGWPLYELRALGMDADPKDPTVFREKGICYRVEEGGFVQLLSVSGGGEIRWIVNGCAPGPEDQEAIKHFGLKWCGE